MALPCALFSSSSSDFSPQEFVKQILRVSELSPPDESTSETKSYKWQIDTKYYSTQIYLCTTEKRTIGDQSFAESVEAFIHYFDPAVPSSFDLAVAWLPYLSHIEPQVQMLVCKSSKDSDAVGRKSTLAWCVENGFELVELEPEPDSDDEDNDFPETKGLARIIQALHAHTWPNLELKDSPPVQSPLVRQMMKEQHLLNKELEKQAETNGDSAPHAIPPSTDSCDPTETAANPTANSPTKSSTSQHSTSSSLGVADSKPNSGKAENSPATNAADGKASSKPESENPGALPLEDLDWGALVGAMSSGNGDEDAPLGENDLGVDEFEQLFMKLKVMKDRAENLPASERKKYAEKVALSFWNAIGGDEDEIGDLDADSD